MFAQRLSFAVTGRKKTDDTRDRYNDVCSLVRSCVRSIVVDNEELVGEKILRTQRKDETARIARSHSGAMPPHLGEAVDSQSMNVRERHRGHQL